MKDVKEIHDIPDIENYLDFWFDLKLYDVGDKTAFYGHYLTEEKKGLHLEIISDSSVIEPTETLLELITGDKIFYLEFSITKVLDVEFKESYCYRPLVPEEDKEY